MKALKASFWRRRTPAAGRASTIAAGIPVQLLSGFEAQAVFRFGVSGSWVGV